MPTRSRISGRSIPREDQRGSGPQPANQLDAEIKRVTASIANDYRAAVANEASLTATLDRRKKEALTVGADLVRLRELERQVDANRAVYETFLVRSRELQEQQKLDTSSSRIISPALPPDRRVGPSSSIILAAALVAGLGLGVGAGLAGVRRAGASAPSVACNPSRGFP